MMRAAPFGDAVQLQVPRAEFRNHLHRLFDENRVIAEKIAPNWSADDQITADMDHIRSLSLDHRKHRYRNDRIGNQRQWYADKAAGNKLSAKKLVITGVIAYGVAATLALLRIRYLSWTFWPIEPVIVFASSVIGWMQVKKYNELGAAYTVAAHEIGLVAPELDAVHTEAQFSDFVNGAELAFSREHTMWIARTAQ
jgi:conflict system pore-forming effector with SLATT domain